MAIAAGAASANSGGAGNLSPEQEERLVKRLERMFPDRAQRRLREALPAEPPHPGRATPALRELFLLKHRLTAQSLDRVGGLLLRPTNPTGGDLVKWGAQGTYTESTLGSARFVVHYVSAPPSHSSCATDAFAQEVLSTLEAVAQAQNGALGWPAPPSDASYALRDNGGDGRYDVYLANLGGLPDPLFGYVSPEEYVPLAPGTAATSFMVIENDYAEAAFGIAHPLDALKVTVAHEFCHSCQFGLNLDDPEWWFYESTATHMEDLVYNDINDYYRFLPAFFELPDVSLRDNACFAKQHPDSLHPYGASVWNHYLAARFGTGLATAIWLDTATAGSNHPTLLETTRQRLEALGTTLEEEFGRFAAWNVLTGPRADPGYYPEGAGWPEIRIPHPQRHDAFPASRNVGQTEGPQALAASYVALSTPSRRAGRIRFEFQGQGTGPWRLWSVSRKGGLTLMQPAPLDSDGHGVATVEEAHRQDWIVFAISNVITAGAAGARSGFGYLATFEPTLGAHDLWLALP